MVQSFFATKNHVLRLSLLPNIPFLQSNFFFNRPYILLHRRPIPPQMFHHSHKFLHHHNNWFIHQHHLAWMNYCVGGGGRVLEERTSNGVQDFAILEDTKYYASCDGSLRNIKFPPPKKGFCCSRYHWHWECDLHNNK